MSIIYQSIQIFCNILCEDVNGPGHNYWNGSGPERLRAELGQASERKKMKGPCKAWAEPGQAVKFRPVQVFSTYSVKYHHSFSFFSVLRVMDRSHRHRGARPSSTLKSALSNSIAGAPHKGMSSNLTSFYLKLFEMGSLAADLQGIKF